MVFVFVEAHLHFYALIFKCYYHMCLHRISASSGSNFDQKIFEFIVASWPKFYLLTHTFLKALEAHPVFEHSDHL